MTPVACFQGDSFQFDPKKLRPQRLKDTIREAARQYEEECGFEDLRRGRSAYRRLFVTLTYAENTRGNPRDVSECLKRMRHWAARIGARVRYAWVAELQKRGALHYHLLVWLPRHLHLPKLDRRGWWRHGMTNVQTARNPVGYLVKYASKCRPEDLERLRKGTRLYGYGGGWPGWRETLREKLRGRWIRNVLEAKREAAWQADIEERIVEQERDEAYALHLMYPDEYPPPESEFVCEEEARQAADEAMEDAIIEEERSRQCDALLRRGRALFARCVGGYVDRVTGEFYESPYFVTFERGCVIVHKKATPPGV